MEIIGNLIKSAIEVGSKFQNRKTPVEAQKEVLKHLLEKAKDTSFGKFHGFKSLLKSDNTKRSFSS